MLMRSKLFVPADRPALFAKAENSAADSISFDLEDAVASSQKAEAREALVRHLVSRSWENGKTIVVRINAFNTPQFERDVEAIVTAGVDIINLPMVEDPDAVLELAERIKRYEKAPNAARILVNIETPKAVRHAAALAAAHERVAGLQLGYADLLEPYGLARRDEAVLSHIRIRVRLAAAEANVPVYDGAYPSVKDLDGFRRECEAARRQGMAGKSCIHPSQIAIANEVFAPTLGELERARSILDAAAEAEKRGQGVFVVDGQMVDRPFIRWAESVIAAHNHEST